MAAGTVTIGILTALPQSFGLTVVITIGLEVLTVLYFVDRFVYHFSDRRRSRRRWRTDFIRLVVRRTNAQR